MSRNTRKMTVKILEAIDDGRLSALAVAEACLAYMGESEVADMAHDNSFFEDEEEDGDD